MLRFYNIIESKKGIIPSSTALGGHEISKINWGFDKNNNPVLLIEFSPRVLKLILDKKMSMFLTKGFNLENFKDKYTMSRFIAKIAVEMFVYENLERDKPDLKEAEIVLDDGLKDIIKHVRIGNTKKIEWTYSCKKTKEFIPFSKIHTCITYNFFLINNDLCFSIEMFDYKFQISLTNSKFKWDNHD